MTSFENYVKVEPGFGSRAGGTGNLLPVLVRLKAGATIEVQVLYGWMPTIQ
jgi:hypothetical protein